jgi:hypothetical protein
VTRERRRRCTDGEVAAALACLDQKARPLPTSRWPGDLSDLEQPGLYAWWVSAAGASQLASGLQHELQAGRIYAGQTGATACPPASSGPPPWPSASPGTTCADASAGRRSGSRSRRACGRRSTWSRPARSCWLANPRRGSASGSASTSPSRSLGGCDHPDCVVPLPCPSPPLRPRPARPAAISRAALPRRASARTRTPRAARSTAAAHGVSLDAGR